MDLTFPGADLLGPNEASALRVLARLDQPVTGRDVARLGGASPSSTRRALLRLQHIGLVSSRDSSHARLYELRREHVLWEPVQQILTATSRVQVAVGRLVAQRLGDRATVALFGSVARGQSTADSDVDIALVLHEEVGAEQRDAVVDELADLVQVKTGNAAQVFTVDRAGLAGMVQAGDPLVRSWSHDAITLSGPDLRVLLAGMAATRPAQSAVTAVEEPVG